MAVSLQRRSFTADEFERMAEAGIFGEDERLELLDGEIVAMSPIGSRHVWCVNRLNRAFGRLGESVMISVQNPVRLGERSTPQPDLAILRPEASEDRLPGPADVFLVVEVASSSAAEDRDVKAPLYARARIGELWIVDLDAERLEVYRDPSPSGYRLVQVFGRGQQISPLFAPDFEVEVDEILGTPNDPR